MTARRRRRSDGVTPCEACGHVHVRAGRPTCAGHRGRRDADGNLVPCLKYAVQGLPVCTNHGGNSPGAREAAAARVQEQEVQAAVEAARAQAVLLGMPVEVSSGKEVLWDLMRWSAGHVAWYRAQVLALAGPNAIVQQVTNVQRTERTGFQAGLIVVTDAGPEVNIWLRLYNEERDRLGALAATVSRLKLDEDRVLVEQQKGARIGEGFAFVQTTLAQRWSLDAGKVGELREVLRYVLQTLAEGAPFALAGEVAS